MNIKEDRGEYRGLHRGDGEEMAGGRRCQSWKDSGGSQSHNDAKSVGLHRAGKSKNPVPVRRTGI